MVNNHRNLILSCFYVLNLLQPVYAEGLERLFTTQEQRASLDAERRKPSLDKKKEEVAKGEESKPLSRQITFNGLVVRSQGPSTVWVNGDSSLQQQGFVVDLEKRKGIVVPLILLPKKQVVWLKPGETVDTLDGKITQNYDPVTTPDAQEK